MSRGFKWNWPNNRMLFYASDPIRVAAKPRQVVGYLFADFIINIRMPCCRSCVQIFEDDNLFYAAGKQVEDDLFVNSKFRNPREFPSQGRKLFQLNLTRVY